MPSLSFSHNRLASCTGNYRRPPYTRGTITCLACCSTPNSATVLRQRPRLPIFWHSRLSCCIRTRPQPCASYCCHRLQHTFCISFSMLFASAARQTALPSESVTCTRYRSKPSDILCIASHPLLRPTGHQTPASLYFGCNCNKGASDMLDTNAHRSPHPTWPRRTGVSPRACTPHIRAFPLQGILCKSVCAHV